MWINSTCLQNPCAGPLVSRAPTLSSDALHGPPCSLTAAQGPAPNSTRCEGLPCPVPVSMGKLGRAPRGARREGGKDRKIPSAEPQASDTRQRRGFRSVPVQPLVCCPPPPTRSTCGLRTRNGAWALASLSGCQPAPAGPEEPWFRLSPGPLSG